MEDCEEIFEELEDPRTGNAKRHLLHEVLYDSALCTVLCGGETCADMALFGRAKRRVSATNSGTSRTGYQSHGTFSRIFRLLDPARFHAWFIGFMQRFAEKLPRGCGDRRQDDAALLRPCRAGFATASGECLGS